MRRRAPLLPRARPAAAAPLLRDRRGTSAAEFCVVAPLVLMVFALVADLGNAIQQSLRLEAAARAGAQYALTFPTDSSAIQAEVRRALPGWSDVSVQVPGMVCHCPGVAGTVNCKTYACPTMMRRYVSISATRPYTPIFAGAASTTLTGRVDLRIQ